PSSAPCRSRPRPCEPCGGPSCRFPLAQNGRDARDVAPHRAELQRVRDRLGAPAEREPELLLLEHRQLLLQLLALEQKLAVLQEEQFRLTFRRGTEAIANPLQFRTMRRDIARIATILRERKAT